VMFLLVLVSTYTHAQGKGKKVGNQTIQIKTSAQCEMCEERIEKALALHKGVKKADLDVESKVVTVVFNGTKTDAGKIKQVIATTGYDADEVEADKKVYKTLPACCKKGGH
jgi:periplasmic mercuric ion binding protein